MSRFGKTPAERTRHLFLLFAVSQFALVLILQALPPFFAIALIAATFVAAVLASVLAFRKIMAKQSDVPVDVYAPRQISPRLPNGQRRAYVIKAGRFYAISFANDSILISPRLDSRRKADRWAASYVVGEQMKFEHEIAHSEISSVAIVEGFVVEISTPDTRYVLDSWFNSFDMEHHDELLGLVERLGLTARSSSDGTGKAISCGGGANMFDFRSAQVQKLQRVEAGSRR